MKSRIKARKSQHQSPGHLIDEAARTMSAGGYQEAMVMLEKALRSAPFNARARCLLGESQILAGNFTAAAVNLKKAVQAAPNEAVCHSSLALALMAEKPDEAVTHFRAAIQLGSSNPAVFYNLGVALLELRHNEEALRICDAGLQISPRHVGLMTNRSSALLALDRYEEGLACCYRLLELEPANVNALSNMGNILRKLGCMAEAEDVLRRACLQAPENGTAHFNLAYKLLLDGQYREGFREYEWRWKSSYLKGEQPKIVQPLWDGSFLDGRRILLHAEQGFGDTIQLVRYLPLVENLGGRIVLAVPGSLCRLMSFLPGGHFVLPQGASVNDFAAHCPLFSLPLMFRTDLESIPPPAPFVIPADLRETWTQRIGGGKLKVALIWAGSAEHQNNRNRSVPLRLFHPLLVGKDIDFFSLQLGPSAAELQSEGVSQRVRDLAPFLTDFAETAAALSCMDLVISVDTAVAHLAGSLGNPVWLLLPFAPDWRWLLGRNDSPWYPSMRLFRQRTVGDWETVVQEMRAELQSWRS